MIVLESAQDVIDIYQQAGRPLDDETLESLDRVRQQLVDLNLDLSFVIIDIRCRICGHEQVTIVPEVADLENLECANCENMTAMEKDSEEDEKEYRGH